MNNAVMSRLDLYDAKRIARHCDVNLNTKKKAKISIKHNT